MRQPLRERTLLKEDLYALPPEAIAEPPRSLGRALLKIGPGLILAGSIVGTGELIATTHLGATVGIRLLWLVLISCFIKVFVQLELGRQAVSSGETTLESLEKMPGAGRFFTWWWLLMMLGTQAQLGVMVGGVGQAFHMALPGVVNSLVNFLGAENAAGKFLLARPEFFWGGLTALATSAALVKGSYKFIERATTLLVVGFTLMTMICVLFLPRGSITPASLGEGLSFQIPAAAGAAMAAFAMFGITGVGAAELIAYPYWCIEKGYARFAGPRDASPEWERRAKGWMRVMSLDAWVSMFVYTAATVAFYLLGAAVLYEQTGGEGLANREIGKVLEVLSAMYVPMLGAKGALWFIVIGAFAVLYSTLFSATAANSRTAADFMQLKGFIPRRTEDRARWIAILCAAFPILDFALFTCVGSPVAMVTIGAVGQALTLPMIAATAVYLRFRRTDPRLKPSRAWDVFLILSMISFFVVAVYVLIDTYWKLR